MNQRLGHCLLNDFQPEPPTPVAVAACSCIRSKISVSQVRESFQLGFTLIELILVIVLMGVLAVFVAPRFDSADFNARGFHDQTLALLRYAQKSAVAQRRTVCVAFTSTTASLTLANTSGATTCATPLSGAGASSAVTARSGVQFNASPLPSNFSFDPLGQPTVGQTIQVVNVTPSITVEAVTGYVHD